jgi:hypothetical protein
MLVLKYRERDYGIWACFRSKFVITTLDMSLSASRRREESCNSLQLTYIIVIEIHTSFSPVT